MSLYVGTSGWAYKQWKPAFYPAKLPQSRFLDHYATLLSACEINNTFYRVPPQTTFDKWAAATPESFRFAVKGQRMMTYRRAIAPEPGTREFIHDFVARASTLGPRLGVVMFQFPHFVGRDDEALKAFLDALPPGTAYALELVNTEWDAPEVADMVAEAGATVCLTDRDGAAPEALPPGPIAYVRLRRERYSDAERGAWLELFHAESAHRHVYAFVKHEEGPADDPNAGVALARWLAEHA